MPDTPCFQPGRRQVSASKSLPASWCLEMESNLITVQTDKRGLEAQSSV